MCDRDQLYRLPSEQSRRRMSAPPGPLHDGPSFGNISLSQSMFCVQNEEITSGMHRYEDKVIRSPQVRDENTQCRISHGATPRFSSQMACAITS